MPKNLVQEHAQALKIPFLIHFTRAENLPGIMRHGFYPRSRIDKIEVVPEINDELRLDRHLDAVSLSIAFPNYRMFYACRIQNPDVEWVVLAVDPSVLWLKDCAFCRHNAADTRISCQPLEQLKTPEAFIGMFDAIEGLPSREEQRLKSYDPTDEQAEVLAFDVIEPNHIGAAVFENTTTRDAYQALLGTRKICVHRARKGLFASRSYVR